MRSPSIRQSAALPLWCLVSHSRVGEESKHLRTLLTLGMAFCTLFGLWGSDCPKLRVTVDFFGVLQSGPGYSSTSIRALFMPCSALGSASFSPPIEPCKTG